MQSSRKQPSRRLEKRENSRRWLLIPALCAAVILAVVLIVELNKQPQVLPDSSNTAVQKWLLENSWRYGFILRYPTDQTDVTGIVYEPWHYRYVGKEYAQDIYKKGLCLEQYLEQWGK